jgi:membrane protein
MARLKDIPKVMHSMGLIGFGKKIWSDINRNELFTWGSALAYAWLFAIFPFLIFLLSLAPYLPGGAKNKAMEQVSSAAYSSVGGDAGNNIVKSVHDVMSNQHGGLLSFGLIVALWGASGGMALTMGALDKTYFVHCSRSFIKQRLIAIVLTVITAVVILLVLFLLPVGSALLAALTKQGHLGSLGNILINIARYAVAIAMLFGIVAMIYQFGPCIKQKWRLITPGAVFTVAVWILLGFAFSFYVSHFGNFNKTYGALGGAIVLLLFFYINAVVLLIGAELNSVVDFEILNVKPGTADISQANVSAKHDPDRHPAPIHLPIVPQRPAGHTGRNVLIYASSVLALRWTWKKIWMTRAKRQRQKTLAKARQPWWRRWAIG